MKSKGAVAERDQGDAPLSSAEGCMSAAGFHSITRDFERLKWNDGGNGSSRFARLLSSLTYDD
jgi:hypothetical protein